MRIEVVAVLPGPLLVVSPKGLRRVEIPGEPHEELLTPEEAEDLLEGYHAAPSVPRGRVVPYRPDTRRTA